MSPTTRRDFLKAATAAGPENDAAVVAFRCRLYADTASTVMAVPLSTILESQ